jgi:hypothetical protein
VKKTAGAFSVAGSVAAPMVSPIDTLGVACVSDADADAFASVPVSMSMAMSESFVEEKIMKSVNGGAVSPSSKDMLPSLDSTLSQLDCC